MYKRALVAFLIIFSWEIHCNDDNAEEEEFIPTHEWQIVKKGQKIPKGLHVRINFETGITEAKLLDDANKYNKDNALVAIPQEEGDQEHISLHPDVLKDSLKKIKDDDILKPEEVTKTGKLRSYEELKEEMDSINLIPKIDAEVLRDLFKKHNAEVKKEKIDVSSILIILEDFEFLAHDYDNGIEFVQQNGVEEVIYKNLNLSDIQIKQETLKLFGSLVQNNPKAQIHVLETGGLNILLRILNLKQSADLKSRALYALSCLLRKFPLAQLRFLQNGGLSVIVDILENDPIKIKTKLVTLMNDLILESMQAFQSKSSKDYSMLITQYRLVNLENLLLEHKWCQYLNKLLYLLVITGLEDHDSIEKCIYSMFCVAEKCSVHYDRNVLIKLAETYKTLALNNYVDVDDEYFNGDYFNYINNLCKSILNQKSVKTEL